MHGQIIQNRKKRSHVAHSPKKRFRTGRFVSAEKKKSTKKKKVVGNKLFITFKVSLIPGRGVDHPPPSSAEVEGRVELYICSPSESSRPIPG
jgi:hypothetical protein